MLIFLNLGMIFEKMQSFQLCVGIGFVGNAPYRHVIITWANNFLQPGFQEIVSSVEMFFL